MKALYDFFRGIKLQILTRRYFSLPHYSGVAIRNSGLETEILKELNKGNYDY